MPFRLLALATLTILAQTASADDLFSRLDPAAVFSEAPAPQRSAASSPEQAKASPVTLATVAAMLRSKGYEVRQTSESGLTTTTESESWTFPTTIVLAESSQLVVVLALQSYDEPPTVERMARLFQATYDTLPASFCYSQSRGRSELVGPILTAGLTADQLDRDLKALAALATSRAAVWAEEESSEAAPDVAAVPLDGQWAATLDGEAFGLAFAPGGRFRMSHVRSGIVSLSEGTFTLTGQTLTLRGTDRTLVSTLAKRSASRFALTITNGPTLAFEKATRN